MSKEIPDYIDEIFGIEAKGMFSDIATAPNIFTEIISLNKTQCENAVSYIKSILTECYLSGGVKVVAFKPENEIYGYGILFDLPKSESASYLHKIFVHQKYRRKGLGAHILQTFIDSERPVVLICPHDKIKFYEKSGFYYQHKFVVPGNGNFVLSNGLHSDLVVMSTEQGITEAPVFLLNDTDLNIIAGRQSKI